MRSKKELVRRYLLFLVSLFLTGLGVALSRKGALGVSPISSVPNVIAEKWDVLSFGTWLMLWNLLLLAGQIVILRRRFQLIQLMQIPLSIIFGWFTDLGGLIVAPIPVPNYAAKIGVVLGGVVLIGLAVALAVIADVVMNSGEAFVKAVSDVTGKVFGNVKVAFDVSCVVLAVLLSLLLFAGRIVGTREGTVIVAVCTGFVVKFFVKILKKPLDGLLTRR